MFKTTWIVLLAQKIRDNTYRVVLLTRDYGKISCWHKVKTCTYGTGDIISIWIEREWSVNKLKSLERVDSPLWKKWKFIEIMNVLSLICLIDEVIPDSMPQPSVFDDYRNLIEIIKSETAYFDSDRALLIQIRILQTLWIFHIYHKEESPMLRYIYNNLRTTSIEKIFQWNGIDEDTCHILQKNFDVSLLNIR